MLGGSDDGRVEADCVADLGVDEEVAFQAFGGLVQGDVLLDDLRVQAFHSTGSAENIVEEPDDRELVVL